MDKTEETLVERLRDRSLGPPCTIEIGRLLREAADEIERSRTEVYELKRSIEAYDAIMADPQLKQRMEDAKKPTLGQEIIGNTTVFGNYGKKKIE